MYVAVYLFVLSYGDGPGLACWVRNCWAANRAIGPYFYISPFQATEEIFCLAEPDAIGVRPKAVRIGKLDGAGKRLDRFIASKSWEGKPPERENS